MLEMFEGLIARLREVWGSMTLNQKVVSGGVFVALFVALAYLSTLRENLVEYTILFTELDAKSASEIITRLEQQDTSYRLSRDGTTIEVPRNRATQLKIELTAEGLPETGIVGFEILDTTTFGMSERIQEVQIQRALQGELSRTLMSLDAVEWANVNLSIPEPTLFIEREEPTKRPQSRKSFVYSPDVQLGKEGMVELKGGWKAELKMQRILYNQINHR